MSQKTNILITEIHVTKIQFYQTNYYMHQASEAHLLTRTDGQFTFLEEVKMHSRTTLLESLINKVFNDLSANAKLYNADQVLLCVIFTNFNAVEQEEFYSGLKKLDKSREKLLSKDMKLLREAISYIADASRPATTTTLDVNVTFSLISKGFQVFLELKATTGDTPCPHYVNSKPVEAHSAIDVLIATMVPKFVKWLNEKHKLCEARAEKIKDIGTLKDVSFKKVSLKIDYGGLLSSAEECIAFLHVLEKECEDQACAFSIE